MSRSDKIIFRKNCLSETTTSESKVQCSSSETDKPTTCTLSDNSDEYNLAADEHANNTDADRNMCQHSYLQTLELELSSQDDKTAFQIEVIQRIIDMHHQVANLENKVQKLEKMVSTLETEKINKEKVGKLKKSNQEHLGFLKKESQKSNEEIELRNRNKITYKTFPFSTYQDQPLDDLFIPDLSKCGKKRIHSQLEYEPEVEPEAESEEEPKEHSNIYLQYKVRELNLLNMSETSLALNKEWPVQLFPSLWPQKNFNDKKCDCLKQFRK
ncbi:uncharacterized protein LOC119687285 [Teleopsis dalmanni]|uniref:uncharacterized protein LOC119687285 n=1 Tax=Teleopsis dalmanni TaxID=139649 RepID=UPI0018CED9BD|nr:uncharacterized protein LOC119687285 [Teleopsis dalmanni]